MSVDNKKQTELKRLKTNIGEYSIHQTHSSVQTSAPENSGHCFSEKTLEIYRKYVNIPYSNAENNEFVESSSVISSGDAKLQSANKAESSEFEVESWKARNNAYRCLKSSKLPVSYSKQGNQCNFSPLKMFMAQTRVNTGSHDGMITNGLNNSCSQSGHFGNPTYFMSQPPATQSMYSYPDTSCRVAVSELSQNLNRSAMAYQNDLRLNYHTPNADYGANFNNTNAGSCYNSHCSTTDMRMNYNNTNGNSASDVNSMNYTGAMNSCYHQSGSHLNNVLYHHSYQNAKPDCSTEIFVKPTTFGEHCSSVRHKLDSPASVMPSSQDAVSVKTELVRNHCPYNVPNGSIGVYNAPESQEMYMGSVPSVPKDDCFRPRISSTAVTAYPNSPSIPSSQHAHSQFTDTLRQSCFRGNSNGTTSSVVPSANGSYEPLTPPPSEPNTSPPLESLPRKTPPPPYPAPFSASKSVSEIPTQPKYNRRNNPELEKRRTHFCNFPGE